MPDTLPPPPSNTITIGHFSTDDGWYVQLNSPITFDIRYEWDDANQMNWAIGYVSGFDEVSTCLAESEGELMDWVIPNMLQGTLTHPPGEDCDHCTGGPHKEEYALFYQYIKNSIDKITLSLPGNMRFLLGTHSEDGGSMEIEII